MKNFSSRNFLAALGVALACSAVQAEFPERPLRIYHPTAPGGAADTSIRLISERAQQFLGQPIIIDNRSGGIAGTIATQAFLQTPQDGHTIAFNTTAMTIFPWLGKMAYDPQDLVPFAVTGFSPYALVVNANFPAKTFDEFVEYAKTNKLSCSTTGVGSPPHLALELLMKEANIDILHVPYRGFSLVYPDLHSGRISCSLEPPISVLQYVRSGSLRALAITSRGRSTELPDAVPISEKYPSVDVVGWGALFVSRKTPRNAVEKLHAAYQKAMQSPDVVSKLKGLGVTVEPQTLESMATMVEADRARYGQIIKMRNIKLEVSR
ncbi:MAG: tripartite tricarboxylate transporter substrate binding protein [Desulfobacterales bacterium]|nr:tripartite tricarboxylate transporter substrate binding protein [Desulfobacterales bacterium]